MNSWAHALRPSIHPVQSRSSKSGAYKLGEPRCQPAFGADSSGSPRSCSASPRCGRPLSWSCPGRSSYPCATTSLPYLTSIGAWHALATTDATPNGRQVTTIAGNGGRSLGRPGKARRTPVAHDDRGGSPGRSEDRPHPAAQQAVRITVDGVALDGDLARPPNSGGMVLFAHGGGSSRHSPRNRQVADHLQRAGLGTLLMDLLTADEEQLDLRSRELRFDIGLLARRLVGAVDWLAARFGGELRVGLFGASTGAAAALVVAAERPSRVGGVVSRGGRPDLAGPALERVTAPTLLIVGGADPQVLTLNRQAAGRLGAPHRLEVVPGAGHLFEEPGALEEVARLAGAWFVTHLRQMSADPSVG